MDTLTIPGTRKNFKGTRNQSRVLLSISFKIKMLVPHNWLVDLQYTVHPAWFSNCLQIGPVLPQSWYQSESRLYMWSIFCLLLSSTRLVRFPHYSRFRKSWFTSVPHHVDSLKLTSRLQCRRLFSMEERGIVLRVLVFVLICVTLKWTSEFLCSLHYHWEYVSLCVERGILRRSFFVSI